MEVAKWEQTDVKADARFKMDAGAAPHKQTIDTAAANAYFKPLASHEEHPWRGKNAFGFATILNRNGEHEVGASPVAMSLPPLQAYPMSSLDKKAHGHGRPTPTPIAPLGENVDMSAMPGRSLKLKIKKKHIDIGPSFQTPIAPSSGARKLPLAPAPVVEDDDDDSGDEGDENAVAANGTQLRGGRWTSEEHERFLSGFRLHGHKWKRVQMVVRSRTVTQVRTHAQKYLLKLQKISGENKSAEGGDRYVQASYGSGATSPTQSMLSANDDPEAHQQHSANAEDPGSPQTTQELPSSPSRLKRSTPTKKGGKPPLKKFKRSAKPEATSIEEAAYALCSLMTRQIEDLEMTDQEEEEEEQESSAPRQGPHKKRYLCRKCRVPKKGHVCDVASQGEEDDEPLEKPSASDRADDNDDTEPLVATWTNVDNIVGQNILRCFGPNTWARGKIDQVVKATDDNEDQIHIVYSDEQEPTRNEWLGKSDAIECVAFESQHGQYELSSSTSGSQLPRPSESSST